MSKQRCELTEVEANLAAEFVQRHTQAFFAKNTCDVSMSVIFVVVGRHREG